jgi:hypothetical protein
VKGKSAVSHSKTGDIIWHEPVTHSVTNTGKNTTKVAVLEFNGN